MNSVTVLFAVLGLTTRRRPGRAWTETAEDFEIVVSPRQGTRSTDHEIAAATSLEALPDLDIPELLPLGAAEGWTGWARVVRACRAGVGARLHLEGDQLAAFAWDAEFLLLYIIVVKAPDSRTACGPGHAAPTRPRSESEALKVAHSILTVPCTRYRARRTPTCWAPGGNGRRTNSKAGLGRQGR